MFNGLGPRQTDVFPAINGGNASSTQKDDFFSTAIATVVPSFSLANAMVQTEYEQLLQQKKKMQADLDEIEQKLEFAKTRRLENVIEEIQLRINEHGLSPEQIFPHLTFRKIRVFRDKYRNPETGETWNGRGQAPAWLKGKVPALFAIAKDAQKD